MAGEQLQDQHVNAQKYQQARNDGCDIGCHAQHCPESQGGCELGHQAEHGNGGKAHCPAYDRHADLLEGIEQVQHGPGFFRGHAHQGNADNDGEDHHLEHLAFNHGIERVAR